MKKCLIVSGGEFAFPEKMREYDIVIACDRGYENCLKMDIRPDLVIGDFDSYEGAVDGGIEVIRLNPVKDDTDTMSAVRHALKEGCDRIDICCAFGGRFDHSMANIQTAAFILENGAFPVLYGKGTTVYGIKNAALMVPKVENSYLSVFAVSDECTGVSVQGTDYVLEDAGLINSFPIGVSNRWKGDEAYISVKKGTIMVIVSENVKVE